MSIEEHLNEISRAPLLTAQEEILLGTQVQRMMEIVRENCKIAQINDSNIEELMKKVDEDSRKAIKRGLKARDRMIAGNMRLVAVIAKKLKTSEVNMTIQDMIQEGAIGLAKAVEKFEPERGYKFSTYAYWWIKQGIDRANDNLERAIRIPLNVQKNIKDVKSLRENLGTALGREPTMVEIAAKLGRSVEKIEKNLLSGASILSLDAISANDNDSFCNKIVFEFENETSEEGCDTERIELILKFIQALPANEQKLLQQAYGIDCERVSIKKIAELNKTDDQVLRTKLKEITKKIKKAILMVSAAKASK